MSSVFTRWFRRNLSNPQAAVLLMLLLVGVAVVLFLGDIFAPIFAALVLAYLLDWTVAGLVRLRIPRTLAVILVFAAFLGVLVVLIFSLVPLIWQQLANLASELPKITAKAQVALLQLPERFPDFVSPDRIQELFALGQNEMKQLTDMVLSASFTSLKGLAQFLIYLVLVPLLIYFFLKDKRAIFNWFSGWLPEERHLSMQVWYEVNHQIGNYIRGKILEIIIVGLVSYITFGLMGLSYALLLAVLVGLSVLIPYVGAAVVTVPIALIAYFQWGFSPEFAWLMIAYLIIQALDGNVLVPVLFSEAVNLHPVAIICAILFFGGIWGFWGIFFAIPLATLVKSVLNAFAEMRRNALAAPTVESVGKLPAAKA